MFKVSDILDGCLAGELQNLNLKGLDDDTVQPARLQQFIVVLSAGLTDLHKRFMLKKGSVRLKLQEGVRLYELQTSKAISGGFADPYIMDSVELPFKGDVLEVLEVFKGREQVQMGKRNGVYLTTPQTLYMDFDVQEGTELDVVYQANHPMLPKSSGLDTPVLLPPSHLQALYYYIGSRMMTPQTTGLAAIEGRAFHEGSHYMRLYEQECERLMTLGMDVDSNNVVSLFTLRGFI